MKSYISISNDLSHSYTTAPLSLFIEHFFYYEGYRAGHMMEKFLPDGSMDMLIDLTETPKKLFHNEDGNSYTTYRKINSLYLNF